MHARALEALGVKPVPVKLPGQLRGLDGLVIPGGESTALLRLCEPIGMLPAIRAFAQEGGALFGTCAGAILLASSVTNPSQRSLDLIDITVERNGYGRQADSMETIGQAHDPFGTGSVPLVFIRAPRITATGKTVKTLVSYGKQPVLVRQGKILAATFHPELESDHAVYGYWLDMLRV